MSARNSTPERSGQGPLCVSAALHGGDLDALRPRIREAAAGASIEAHGHGLTGLLAEGWCNAVEEAMEDHALSTGEKRGLVATGRSSISTRAGSTARVTSRCSG